MLYVISWGLALLLLTLWSTFVWVLHALALWSFASVGVLAGQSQAERLPVPAWLEIWIPAGLMLDIKTTAAAVLPWIESAMSALPSLAGWMAPVAWTVWGIGFVLLALGAVALHALIAMTQRKTATA